MGKFVPFGKKDAGCKHDAPAGKKGDKKAADKKELPAFLTKKKGKK